MDGGYVTFRLGERTYAATLPIGPGDRARWTGSSSCPA